jgi:hypothetical protein
MGPKRNGAAANKKRCDERNNKGKAPAAKISSAEPKGAETESSTAAEQLIVTDADAKSAVAEKLPSLAAHHAGFHQPADDKQGSPKNTAADSDDEWVMLDANGKEETAHAVDCKA